MASTNTYNPRIQYLTDEMIDTYAGDNKLTTYKDINKKSRYYDEYIPGGVLDGIIFGSMFAKQCNCGKVRIPGKLCSNCKSILLDEAAAWRRYAKIELPVHYVNTMRKKNFYKFMESHFSFKFKCSDEFMEMVTGRNKNLDLLFDFCQFEYDEAENKIIVTDQIDDVNKCSYEGLIQIIGSHYPQHAMMFKQFVNSSILVVPMPARAPRYVYEENQKVLQNHQITSIYKCIIRACNEYYNQALDYCNEPIQEALLRANLRKFINRNFDLVSQLLKPSKENYSRMMQSHRLTNSGRCTIVPAPDLKVDEVYVPRHLMYEACREEFIDYLAKVNGWSNQKATDTYINEATSPEIQQQFDDYIDHGGEGGMGKYVIINRNPTLYELGMFATKVKLTNNYTMGLPLLLCSPLGGDFDGDSMSFYAIPDDIAPEIVSKMSPRNLIYYKKNQKPLYTPSHEMMAGLLIATKLIEDPEGRLKFESYDEANQYRKTHREFKWQTKCVILIDNEYKETTLGRAKLSELFGKDLDAFLYTNKSDCLTSDLVVTLYDNLAEFDDRMERIQAIQEFALSISTMSGATAPKLSDLHAHLDKSYLDRIKAIEDSDKLSAEEKDIKIRSIFEEFVEHSRFEYDENGNPVVDVNGKKVSAVDENGKPRISTTVLRQVSESSRARESQLLSMVMPQLNVGTDKVAHVGQSTLVEGMTPTDYVRHSIENRLVQDIKQSATPRSGYTTRQLVTLGASFFYTEQEDPKNKGILIPKKKASGRTTIDGEVISRQDALSAGRDEMVRVRSIVTCTLPDKSLIPGDCISRVNKWNEGDNVGISLLSSLTEGLTQSGLSLKHGGSLFESDKLSCIKAPEDGTAQLLENFVIFTGSSGIEYTYPRSINFVLNYSPSGKYSKGQVIGVAYRLFTPSYKLDSIITLIGAQGTASKKTLLNNRVLVTECYAYGPGKIKYQTVNGQISSVKIGEYVYSYNNQACYFLPEGTEVKQGQRFCTGLLDLDQAIAKLHNYLEIYNLFASQFDELIPGMQSELIEMMYSIIVRNVNGAIKHTNVRAAVRQTGSLYTNMAFMDSKSVLRSIPMKGTEFLMDSFSAILLPSFFMNEI